MKKILLFFLIFYSSFIYAQNQSIKIVKEGKGKTMLLLPGFTCPGEIWNETISQLGKGYEFIKVSYPGFNGIEPIEIPWYGTIKSELKQFIIVNKLSNITIIGHSMGGMLAMDLAAELPEKVDKLILVEAIPCIRQVMMPNVSAEHITFDNPYNNNMIQMSDSLFRNTAESMAQGMTNNKDKTDLLAQWIIESDRKTYVYGYTELLKLDLRDKLANIKAKTLILSADFMGKDVVLKNLESQYEKLDNKEIKIAKSSKHFIMFDQPDWFNNELSKFLKL